MGISRSFVITSTRFLTLQDLYVLNDRYDKSFSLLKERYYATSNDISSTTLEFNPAALQLLITLIPYSKAKASLRHKGT